MKNRLYADGVENISLIEGMVRLELFDYEAPVASGGAPVREPVAQLILPPAAFLRAFESMQCFVNELEKKGVVSRLSGEKPRMQAPASPNFDS